jgi:uncharacterized repeat protein (TIGR01451 family)
VTAAVVLGGVVLVPPVTAVPASAGRLPGHLTSPGEPGTPQPPTPLYTEDLSYQSATSAAITVLNYTGSPGTTYVPGVSGASSETYSGSPNWASGTYCDGWILNGSSPLPPAGCTAGDWSALKTMANALGVFQGMTASAAASNQALAEFTEGNPGAGVEFQTNNPIPAMAGHFYQVTAVFGADSCPNGATKASETFSLIVNGTVTPVATGLDPCTDPGRVAINGIQVASLKSSALQVTGASPTLGIQLYNAQSSGAGNDVAFDLPQIMDVTPQLDKSFTPGTITSGGVSTLTFVVTNTSELAAKNGWSFTDDLPAGVTATGVNSTTCPSGTVTAGAGASSVAVSGNLNAGEASCSVTVQVTASAAGTYSNGPGNFPAGTAGLNGLNPPGTSALTVAPPLSLVIAKQSSTTALTAAGEVVTYKFVVTNRSAVTLTGVAVADTQEPPASPGTIPVTCATTTLAPGDSTTCYGTYAVTAADVSNGSLKDSATASGTNPSGGTVTTPPSTLTISLPSPGISVVKSSSVTEATVVGQQIPYSFLVTNTGNVPLDDVAISDTQRRPATQANMSAVTCPDSTLAAGASETCNGTYTVTQADLNNGAVADSAVASGTAPDGSTATSAPSAQSIPAQPPGALTIVKSTTTVAVTGIGQVIPYTFLVTNDSAATVNNITVTDTVAPPSLPANLSAVTCLATTLAPGASTTCTATYQTTSADLNQGAVSDTASATGTGPLGATVYSGQSSVTLTVPTATISIVKAATVPSISVAGQQIPYRFTVTNTGNQPLAGVSVTDTQVAPALPGNMSPVSCPQPDLAAGASETCIGSYTVAQADIGNGSVNDYATASATGPSGTVTSPQSSASVPVQSPPLVMVKSSPDDSYDKAGQQVSYAFTVTNLSTVTYTNIQVQDTQAPPASQAGLSAISCPQPDLAAGTSETCTASYTVTQADVDHGTLADSATATGVEPSGSTDTTPRSSVILPATQAPALTVAKSTTKVSVTHAGQQVPYSFTVTNTGNETLTGVAVTDTVTAPSDPANLSPVTCPVTTLAPGASTTCTATYTVTQADVDHGGSVRDSATATGTPPSGSAVTSPASPVSVPVAQAPALTVVKSAVPATVHAAGDVVTYSFAVTNTGNVTLTGVAVSDTQAPPAGSLDGPVTCPVTTLAPGVSTTCTATYTVTQADVDNGSVSDSASASGASPSGPAVTSPASTASVAVAQAPGISIVKSASASDVAHFLTGQVITYTFVVTNTGNVTLAPVTVTDTGFTGTGSPSAISCPAGGGTATVPSLAPGTQAVCTATYTLTTADVDAGHLSDTGDAAGTPPSGPAVTAASTLDLPAAQNPAISIVKSASPGTVHAAGDVITYSFTVTNTGNTTLTGIAVSDTQLPPASQAGLSPVTCPHTTLAPGEFTTCTATYTVTQADADHGSVNDSATASGTSPAGPAVTSPPTSLTVPVPAAPALSVVKSAPSAQVHAAGDVITYDFAVTNTGNVTLTSVAVQDTQAPPAGSLDGPVTCPDTTLAPGDSVTCTATYTVTQADVDNGSVDDSATASGTPPSGPAITSPASAVSVPIPAGPAINIVKSATPAQVHAAHDVVTYRFTVTNTGNDTLSGVTVSDTQAAPAGSLDGPVTCPQTTLAPGDSVTCTATYTVTQADIDNGGVSDTASASGSPPSGPAVTSPAVSLTVTAVQSPALSVVKSTTTASVTRAGQQVPYTFLVTNAGNVTLTGVTVTDTVAAPSDPADLSPVTCPVTTLAPGGSTTCTATYTATQANVDHGSLGDSATVTGTPPATPANPSPSPLPPSQASAVTVPAAQHPGISVVKTVVKDPVTAAGEVFRYSFLVSDTGNVTLRAVGVTDVMAPPATQANLSAVTCPRTTLAPGASVTCTATYTVTQADVAHGSLGNTAVAYGTPPYGPVIRSRPHTISVTVTGAPAAGAVVIPTGEGANAAPGTSRVLAAAGAAALAAGTLLLTRRRTLRRG